MTEEAEAQPRLVRATAARWTSRVAIAVMLLAGLLLVFLLVAATRNHQLYEDYYARLLWANVVVAVVLALVIVWGFWRLLTRLRAGKFGSRLLLKLAAIFALVGVVPGMFVYTVSYQFVSRSIEAWFDVKVEGALASGLTLARTTIDAQAEEFSRELQLASGVLSSVPDRGLLGPLEQMRTRIAATEATAWSDSGQFLASTGRTGFQLVPPRPPAPLLRLVRDRGVVTQIEGMDEAGAGPPGYSGARVRVFVFQRTQPFGLLASPRVIEAVQALPDDVVHDALAVQDAYREYQERALGRDGLRRMYIGTLTLSLFLAVFGAVVLAIIFGKQLATPLLVLAHGVRQVAAGDLRPKLIAAGRDELGGLTRSFADMTQQLADARAAVDTSMHEVTAARAHLQTILDNLTAGVIVLDSGGLVQSANPGATRILRAPLAAAVGNPLGSLPRLETFALAVERQFVEFEELRDQHGLDHWQKAFELYGNSERASNEGVTLVARGAALPGDLRLLVFDDISEIVSAQRTEAWGEVARRLAHEIKNPLTPIQLSAERLQRRLAGKLGDDDQAVLDKSVHTIVDQVDAMQRLVNEFREYARLPTARLERLDLNRLVEEVLHLYDGAEQRVGDVAVPLHLELDPACPPILGDAQQLRQVIHNLVQNALDASGSAPDRAPEGVVVQTHWSESSRRVRLNICDHGPGFPEAMLRRVFEPYITTKARGTGLGLPMVRKIADEHHARVDVSNRTLGDQVLGAQVSLAVEPVPQTAEVH